MGLFGDILGSAVGIGSVIYGGIQGSKAAKNVRSSLMRQQEKNRDMYDRLMGEDATQLADAQAMLTKTEEAVKERNRAAAGAAAVTGGTEESVAATKAANAQAMADATAQIAVNGERRKDAARQQYQQRDAALQAQLDDLEMQRGGNVAQAAMQGIGVAGNVFGS